MFEITHTCHEEMCVSQVSVCYLLRCQQTGFAPLLFVTHADPLCLRLSLTLIPAPLVTLKRLQYVCLTLSFSLSDRHPHTCKSKVGSPQSTGCAASNS